MSGKVFLETIRVARHVTKLGARPVSKATVQALAACEQIATSALKSAPVEEILGKQRSQQVWDSYLQVKDVVGESAASLSHQSLMSALQSGSQVATNTMQQAGFEGRVIGPFDIHWNMRKVVSDLRAVTSEREKSREPKAGPVRLTPKRFVQFMREAQRKRKRLLRTDPIDAYVDRLLDSGAQGMGSGVGSVLEKKIYKDVAGIICFAFDQALIQADGTQLWGHELHIKKRRSRESDVMEQLSTPAASNLGHEQVEAIVDQMLRSEDLRVMPLMQGVQRRMLVNCSMMILQLIEFLTSDQRMQVSIIGHSLRCRVEPLPLEKVLMQAKLDEAEDGPRFHVNNKAIEDVVEALMSEESDLHSVFVPDVMEAEVYRCVLHRALCITQFILNQLQIKLFGIEVRLNLVAEEEDPQSIVAGELGKSGIGVMPEQLQTCLDRLEDERKRIVIELHLRQEGAEALVAPSKQARRGEAADAAVAPTETAGEHEFQRLAAQDRLARSMALQHNINCSIELAFEMVSDFDTYSKWMPFCSSGQTLEKISESRMTCEVGFGLETGTILGTVGDNIRYNVMLVRPGVKPDSQAVAGSTASLRTARVVADTMDGFAYGKRLVYDWRFAELPSGETGVQLDIFFQAKNVFSLPLWDSMQAMITSAMMKKFIERAAVLNKEAADAARPDHPSGSASPTSSSELHTPP